MQQPAQANDLVTLLNQFTALAKEDLKQASIGHYEEVKTLLHQELQIQGKLDHFQEQLNQFIEGAKTDLSTSAENYKKQVNVYLNIELTNFKKVLKERIDEGFQRYSADHKEKLNEPIRIYTEEKEKCEVLAEKIEADRNALTQREELLSQQCADYETKKSTLDDQEGKLKKEEEQVRDAQKDIQDREEEVESAKHSAERELVEAKKSKRLPTPQGKNP